MTPVDTAERPVYQQMAAKALQLRELGLSDRGIAKRLGVTDKTVAKEDPVATQGGPLDVTPHDRRSVSR